MSSSGALESQVICCELILDRTPKGRDESDEMWVRRHDEYDA